MSRAEATAVFAPAGPLTMQTAPAALEEGRRLAAAGDLRVDFSAVSVADSAALALVLEWLRASRAGGHRLVLSGLPAGLVSLAALYDVDALLPQAAGA